MKKGENINSILSSKNPKLMLQDAEIRTAKVYKISCLEVIGLLILGGEGQRVARERHPWETVVLRGGEQSQRVPPSAPGIPDPATRVEAECVIRPIPQSSGIPSVETWSSHRRRHGDEAREKEESDGHGIIPDVRVG